MNAAMNDTTDVGAELEGLRPRLRSFALRMLANADDAEDAVQDAMVKALTKAEDFRGQSSVSTWIFSILTRVCLDRLRHRQRWRWDAQELTRRDDEAPHDSVRALLRDPRAAFDVNEHIAYCFSCVSRSLPPEEAAALLLREVFGFGNREAARICGVSESVLRHRLSAGRNAMKDTFERLCALVNKQGVCYQCRGLREQAANPGGDLPEMPTGRDESLRRRLHIVRDADLTGGVSAELHALMFRAVGESELRRDGR